MNTNSKLGNVNLQDLLHSVLYAVAGVTLTTINTHIPANKEEWMALGLNVFHTATAICIMKFGFNSNNQFLKPEVG